MSLTNATAPAIDAVRGFARRLGVLALGAAFVSAPAFGDTRAAADDTAREAVIAVMAEVKEDWDTADFEGLEDHWDMSDPSPLYIAEESDQIMTSWDDIHAYWEGTDAWNEWIVVDYSNYHLKRIDDDHVMLTFDLRFDVKLNDRPNVIGGDNRAVVGFRKIDGEWKIFSWVEAPLAAITYVRKLYELNVRDDLPPR